MSRTGKVFMHAIQAGVITEDETGYSFAYSTDYLQRNDAEPVSLTLPLRDEPFISKTMLPFFDGLIPEGWLLDIVQSTWKIDSRDRMGLLLACCKDCYGTDWQNNTEVFFEPGFGCQQIF
ncbi:MAG: HipA N-terminal domain-containing protein [bacterium]